MKKKMGFYCDFMFISNKMFFDDTIPICDIMSFYEDSVKISGFSDYHVIFLAWDFVTARRDRKFFSNFELN